MSAQYGKFISPTVAEAADHNLLRLGALLDAAWRAQETLAGLYDADIPEANVQAVGRIVDEITVMPATTLAGLRIKARALLWARDGAAINAEDLSGSTTDIRVACAILNDICAMECRP